MAKSMVDWILVFWQLTYRPRRWASSFNTSTASRRTSSISARRVTTDVVCIFEISNGLHAQCRPQEPSVRCRPTFKGPVHWKKGFWCSNCTALPDVATEVKPVWDFPLETHAAHCVRVKILEHVDQIGRYAKTLSNIQSVLWSTGSKAWPEDQRKPSGLPCSRPDVLAAEDWAKLLYAVHCWSLCMEWICSAEFDG